MAKKIFKYRGKTIEELQALSVSDFIALLPSRQKRTFSRGWTEPQKVFLAEMEKGKNNVKTHCRGMMILPSFVGKTIQVYRGNKFEPVIIAEEMIGHSLGEFALSRKLTTNSSPGVGATKSSARSSVR